MRVYEFAKKIGATSAAVMKMAEESHVEVYSALSELEPEDVTKLNQRFLKTGTAAVKAQTAAAAEKAQAKVAKAAANRVAHDKAQSAALEAARKRALDAHNGLEPELPVTDVPVVAKAASAKKPDAQKVEIGVSLAEMPKVSYQVSETDDNVIDDSDDFDELDARDYLHGKDLEQRPTTKGSSQKKEKEQPLKKEKELAPKKEKDVQPKKDQSQQPKKEQPRRDQRDAGRRDQQQQQPRRDQQQPRKPGVPASQGGQQQRGNNNKPGVPGNKPPSQRVGGLRAGFSSVSMKVSRPQVQIGVGKPVISTGKPTVSISTGKPSVTISTGKPAVSISTGKPSVTISTGKPAAGASPAPAAAANSTISLSVSTREISIRGAIVVKELALKLGIRPNRLIADLMGLKVLATINQRVEPEVATKVAQKYGYKVNIEHARDAANKKPVLKAIDADDEIPEDKPEDMIMRAPVVTFLGHVDHGKTTLMDYIRHAHVAAGEAGGITQQISAYQVDVQGRKITFLDTPGHAAFNAMRQRGAQLTDIAVIIIAADDGIMPQTEEAIKFARQAGVQIMVAITKCDKPVANVQRVQQQLQKIGLTPEEWGGDIVCCPVSGTTGQGVDNLLEMMLLQADVLELTANPKRRANGYVIEAELEQGFGPSATLLVTGGTLKVGDAVLIGEHFGKVRSLIDDRGRRIKEAPPSTPVKCTGLSGVPEAGAEFRVMLDEKRARTLAEEAARVRKEHELSQTKAVSLDDLMSQMGNGEKQELSIVVKSDTQGSLEAIVEALRGIKSEKVSLKIIGTGTGNVSLTDVKSAAAGKAVIVGFDIGCDSGVQQQARHDGVRINSFRIIYELIDHVKKTMLDLLPPEYTEKVKGHAEIKAVYDIGKLGKIAGSQMLDGMLTASARYRILRNKSKIWDGKVQTLRHFKDEVKEVTGQQECGICFANFEGFAEGDIVECYILEELPRSL